MAGDLAAVHRHRATPKFRRTVKKRMKRYKANGLCAYCGKPVGTDGTTTMCRPHADHLNEWTAARRAEKKAAKETQS